MSSVGIDASLAILRQELEAMQKQDKALYSQLLTLQESIRGLKTELKKEREQCEEAFKDLEEASGTEFEDDVFLEGSEQNLSKTSNEKNEDTFNTQETWKHDRQDSGISVKTPEAENQESRTTTSNHHTHDFVSTRSQGSKPELISHGKQDLNPHVKTVNVELPQKKTRNTKPVLIQHSSQDSGILIDEEAMRGTTLLSKLVESSEMREKLENRKFDRIVQNEWNKIRENSLGNRGVNKIHHERSRSSNDLLKLQPQRTLHHQHSTPCIQPKHAHTNSCPQSTLIQFTVGQGKENEKSSLKQFDRLRKVKERQRLSPSHSRTSSCPQNILKQFPAQENVQTFEKSSIQRPNELGKVNGFITDEKQQSKLPNEGDVPLIIIDKQEKSQKDDGPNPNHQGAFDRAALSLALNTGSRSPRSIFKQNFHPKHHHTRSLPTTPVRELIVAENLLSRQDNRRSMQNISEFQVVTSKQVRPRKRSASFVDLDHVGEDGETGATTTQDTLTPRKASVVQVDSLKQVNLEQGMVSPKLEENSFTSHKANVIKNDCSKETGQHDKRKNNSGDLSLVPRKANVVQVDSFSVYEQTRNSSKDITQNKESPRDNTVTSHNVNVVQVNSVPGENTSTQNKARVVHVNLKQSQGSMNLTQNQANENGELKAVIPLRAVLVSATEVNVSNITDKQTLSRKSSLDERATGNHRASDGPQRRFTITNFKTERLSPRPQPENGKLSPRFLAPKNHVRHNTMPEYDVLRRRHSLYAFHAPSKSWDGYASRRPSEVKRMVRSASQVSLV